MTSGQSSGRNGEGSLARAARDRRGLGADSARTDPVLAPLIISQVGTTNGDYGKVVTFSSPQSRASAGGYKMIYQRPKQNAIPTCYRVGTAPTVQ